MLRATEDAVDALARLDEQVASAAPGFATLLMLRSAQAIVAANDRPLGSARTDDSPDGDAGFAALLGWWYAPTSREFITDDPHLRGTALALDAAADMMCAGRPLTLGLLEEALHTADVALGELPDAFDETLRIAEMEVWPPLLLCAELSSGTGGQLRSIPASIARAVAPLASGLTTGVFVTAGCADTQASALHMVAREARVMRRRVMTYREECAQAAARCSEFGRGGASAQALVGLLAKRPAVTVAAVASALDLTAPTAGAAVERLVGARLLREITGRARDRVFVYTPAVTLAG